MSISVLVVDDHAVFADALRTRLAREGDMGPVTVAYSVAEGRERLLRDQVDIAIVDMALDDGSGLDLARHAREVSPDTAVIVLSAVDGDDNVLAAVRLGVSAWLAKTIDTKQLIRVVRGVKAGGMYFEPRMLGRVLRELVSPAPDPLAALTRRELEVLELMVAGKNRADIAAALDLSVNTVRTHTQNLMAKLDAHSALEAVAMALRAGMGTSPSI